jgi:hypothetical protein
MDPKAAAHLISAFPHSVPTGSWGDPSCGMQLRDYFAAKALMGLLAEPISEGVQSTTSYMAAPLADDQPGDLMARAAYRLADAMLKAREA